MKHPLHLPLVRLLAVSLAVGGAVAQESQSPAKSQQLKKGDVAPAFSVLDPKGATVKLADFAGKIVIVDVSATWCGPCQSAMPNNDRIFRKYRDQGVVLMGITADDTREAYDGWQQRNASKYEFTMYFDPAAKDGWKESPFRVDYKVTGFPTMFVIGRDGKLAETLGGGGAGEDYRLEYALARAGAKVDLASLPPEPKPDPAGPKSVPMVGKTKAMPMIGMGGAPSAKGLVADKFGSVARGEVVPECKFEGVDGKPVLLSSLRGKPVLLHFTTSNGPQPWFTAIAASYREQGVTTLVVFSACDREAFVKWSEDSASPGFAIAWDPSGKAWAENVTNTIFGVGMYPATAVVDAEGKLVSGTIGMGGRAALVTVAMLGAAGVKLTTADQEAVNGAETALRAAPVPAGAIRAATITPAPGSTAAGNLPAAPKQPLLAAGEVAPNFLSVDVAGKEVHLADYAGKVVVLDFWATWCGPCQQSLPHTQAMAQELKDQDVVVLAVCTSDKREAFEKWVAGNGEKYRDIVFTCDPNERGSATFAERASAMLYHVSGIPTKFVIGRDGKVVASVVGYEEGDVRTEAVLARAGVKIDAAVVEKGNGQLAKDEEEAKAGR
jgi:peroxiredoxin